jgi:abortive infection bacteriophage resistance protein
MRRVGYYKYKCFCLFLISQTNENMRSNTTLCHITQCYVFRFAGTIIRHFCLQQFKNVSTFEHTIILLVDH